MITDKHIEALAKLVDAGQSEAAKKLAENLVALNVETPAEAPCDFSQMGEKRAAFERALHAGKEKEASGINNLKRMLEDVIYGNRFQKELSRWTDESFDESKTHELQEALTDSIENLLWTYMR